MRFNKDPAVVKAGFVHLLTASGALIALLALQAIYQGDAKEALLWLLAALVIDGIDGPLARKFRVKEHMPQIDGMMLDLIVDFLSYVFVPVVYIWHFELLPPALEWLLLGAILLSSLYLFAYTDMKGDDNYFNGFPSVWNLVLFFWVILETPVAFNALSTLILCVLTFVPIKSVHPVRVKRFNALNVVLVAVWIALCAMAIMTLPDPQSLLRVIWTLITAWFIGFSFWRTFVG
jgi:phosphatidylcholine synthase